MSELDTNSTGVISLRVSRRAVKKIAITGVVGCLAVTGLANAVSGFGPSLGTQADVVSVERSHKSDRLQLAPKHTLTVPSPVVITLSRPPMAANRLLAVSLIRNVRTSLAAVSREIGDCERAE